VTAGLDAVGIRVPAHPVALALIRAANLPVAAPSANRFTQLSPTSADHVAQALGDRVDLLLDGGPAQVGIESTVVDLTGPRPRLLRPGMISLAALEEVVGPLAPNAAEPTGDAPRLSPGQVERHYAPRATLVVLPRSRIMDLANRGEAEGADAAAIGALVYSDVPLPKRWSVVRLPERADGYAHGLYAGLHQLDDAGCARIVVELPPSGSEWSAVHDRLRRAAQ
jgi:L-threonylcarbamoyladenylate synthase